MVARAAWNRQSRRVWRKLGSTYKDQGIDTGGAGGAMPEQLCNGAPSLREMPRHTVRYSTIPCHTSQAGATPECQALAFIPGVHRRVRHLDIHSLYTYLSLLADPRNSLSQPSTSTSTSTSTCGPCRSASQWWLSFPVIPANGGN
jgi:hypothetical protein